MRGTFLLGVSLVAGLASCGPRRPSAFADLPSEVDVVMVPFGEVDTRKFRVLDKTGKSSSFSYKTPAAARIEPAKLEEVNCHAVLGGSGMCPDFELRCLGDDGDVRFDMDLRKDGRISVHLGPPWETTPEDLVETRLLTKSSPEMSQARATLDAQLVEGVVDASSLEIRGQFRKGDSPWFNQLSCEGDEIFVAIHEAHPHYQQVLLTLSLVGKIWAANSLLFTDCGFSR